MLNAWETGSHTFSSLSPANTSTQAFASMSLDFSDLLLAGTVNHEHDDGTDDLERIGEEEPPQPEETNPHDPLHDGDVSSVLQRVREEEVESKINAWEMAKIAEINNRFTREDAIINGWESEEIHKATCRMKKVERKLEEKKAKALEKVQNNIAKARRKAEEKRASAEAKRATKVAVIVKTSDVMRIAGRAPVKRSFF